MNIMRFHTNIHRLRISVITKTGVAFFDPNWALHIKEDTGGITTNLGLPISVDLWPKHEDPEGSEAKKLHVAVVQKLKSRQWKIEDDIRNKIWRLRTKVYREMKIIDQIEKQAA